MFIKDIWLWFSFISRLFYSGLIKYSEHWSRILLFSGTVCVRVVLVLDCHITCIIKWPKVFGGGDSMNSNLLIDMGLSIIFISSNAY